MELVVLLVMVAAMYAILIVPQQRRMKKKQEMLSSLKEGEEVLTSAGIYGNVVEVDGTVVYIDIGEGIELKMARESIETVLRDPEAADVDADADDDESVDHKGPIS